VTVVDGDINFYDSTTDVTGIEWAISARFTPD
jgi:hypothetical protein